jgi:lipopolysaccharide assembly outer membrane protein LptD (OstA)
MSMRFIRSFGFASLAVLLSFGAAGGPSAGAEEAGPGAGADSALYRVDAARLRWTTEDGERVIYLEGGVRIEHQTTTITSAWGKHYPSRRYTMLHDSVRVVDGTAEMTSNEGEYFGETNTVALRGSVRVRDTGWHARCDRATYDRTRQVAVMTGNLSLADSTRTLYADTIVYDRTRETADARGGVVLIDDSEDYSIAGSRARYDRARRSAVVDANPVLTFDLRADEKGVVTSRVMRFDVDRKLGIAEGDVRLAKGETRASCDSAAIYDEEGRIELYGKPEATSGRSSMSGTRMILWYDDDAVTRVVLPAEGRIVESPREDSPWREDSWIEGDSIVVHLSNERVDSVRIERSARAMYYPTEETERKVSNNYSAGDRMFFVFRGGELSYLRIDGRSTGLYKFLNLGGVETIDSLAASIDTSLSFRSFEKASERVRYSADTIEYYAARESIVMRGKAVLKYQDSSLEARRIDYDSRSNIIEATGDPVLEEEGQRMFGVDMGYDMDNGAGVVVDGSTKYDEGYYVGRHIFKVGSDVLKVYRSTYTTCDLVHPHYSLRANKMKVYIDDKIVSGPITLYIGELPIFYLPFMVNSLRRDRSSGFLRPNFDIGIDSREGRFIRGLGYYWATNDYTDFTFVGDFNERRNLRFNVANRYKLRYVLDGDVRFDLVRQFDPHGFEWRIESNHSQQFSRTASLRSRLQFVSSDEAQQAINRSEDIQRFIDRRIYSTASYRQSWGGTSLSLSASRDQKLAVQDPRTPSVTMTLPSLSLVFPRTSLWFGEAHSASERTVWERVLREITFAPNISANHTRSESDVQKRSLLTANSGAGFSRQQKLGFLDVNPSVNLRWNYQKEIENSVDTAGTGIVFTPARAEYRNEASMSLSTGVGTKIYGTFRPRIGSLAGVRHTLSPVVSWQYTPKLSERQRASQSVSWELRNSIDLKLLKGEQETKQNGVFTWYLSGSYYPDSALADAFSDISSSMRLQAGSLISFNLNQTWSVEYREIVSTTFSTGFDLRGSFSYPAVWKEPERERVAAARAPASAGPDRGGSDAFGTSVHGEGGAPGAPSGAGSWSFRLNYNLSQSVAHRALSGGGVAATRRTDSNLDLSGALSLTKNWRITYYGYYNVEARDFTEYRYAIERDLHCWRASFNHRRFGDDWSYYFQIAIKAHPDIMYEQGTRGIQSFGAPGGGFLTGGY